MAITPINKKSISDQVFDQLKEQIVSGVWKTGEKIPSENVLAEMLGVSRVTVRQALQKLTVLGLLETRTGEGSFVQREDLGKLMKVAIAPSAYLKPHTLREVFTFRRAIEIQTAGIAAMYATEENIAELRDAYERQMQIDENTTVESFAQDDLNFHIAIAKCTNNSLIMTVYEVLWDVLSNAMKQTVNSLGFEHAITYHGLIADAIASHDVQKAEEVMRKHLDTNESVVFGRADFSRGKDDSYAIL